MLEIPLNKSVYRDFLIQSGCHTGRPQPEGLLTAGLSLNSGGCRSGANTFLVHRLCLLIVSSMEEETRSFLGHFLKSL